MPRASRSKSGYWHCILVKLRQGFPIHETFSRSKVYQLFAMILNHLLCLCEIPIRHTQSHISKVLSRHLVSACFVAPKSLERTSTRRRDFSSVPRKIQTLSNHFLASFWFGTRISRRRNDSMRACESSGQYLCSVLVFEFTSQSSPHSRFDFPVIFLHGMSERCESHFLLFIGRLRHRPTRVLENYVPKHAQVCAIRTVRRSAMETQFVMSLMICPSVRVRKIRIIASARHSGQSFRNQVL